VNYLPRSRFFALAPNAVGTGDVESMRSYLQRLAAAHSMTPRTLISMLLSDMGDRGWGRHVTGRMKRSGFSGTGPVVRALTEAVRRETTIDLTPVSMERFGHLIAAQHLTRAGGVAYCPECLRQRDGTDLPHGRLIWELGFVTACPRHGVKLRDAAKCGAPTDEHLPANRRPSMAAACGCCGSIGYRCLGKPEPASAAEIWVARQAASVVGLPQSDVEQMDPGTVRSGIQSTVNAVFHGEAVTASRRAGLARACVLTWLQGRGAPSLGPLFKFAFAARADVSALMLGAYVPDRDTGELDSDNSQLDIAARGYVRHDWKSIAHVLRAARQSPQPPSLRALSRALKVDLNQLRRTLPAESRALAEASTQRLTKGWQETFDAARAEYSAAAAQLRSVGVAPTAKRLQAATGLMVFKTTRETGRGRALKQILAAQEPCRRGADTA